MDNNYDMLWDAFELRIEQGQLEVERWIEYHLFTWNWWLLVLLFIVPWIIWMKFVDRQRIFEIFSFGMVTVFVTAYLDATGLDMGFWVYPFDLVPFGSQALSFDASLIPVAFMMIYQYFNTWLSFFISLLCMAVLYAFIGEPLAHWVELTYYPNWKYIYSFFFYIFTGLLVRLMIIKMQKVSINFKSK